MLACGFHVPLLFSTSTCLFLDFSFSFPFWFCQLLLDGLFINYGCFAFVIFTSRDSFFPLSVGFGRVFFICLYSVISISGQKLFFIDVNSSWWLYLCCTNSSKYLQMCVVSSKKSAFLDDPTQCSSTFGKSENIVESYHTFISLCSCTVCWNNSF